MQEINDIVLEEEQEDINEQEDQSEERSTEDEIRMIKKAKESKKDEEIDEKIVTFLHEKGLSENLIKTLIKNDLTDEHIRFLKGLNLNDDNIDYLQDLWKTKIEINKSSGSSINSITSSNSLSNDYIQLSPNSLYLKKVLSKPLIQALCDIVAKKPSDPIEYLGHWLLHYKICEERAIQQKKRELELSIDREKLDLKDIEEKKSILTEQKEDEDEYSEDHNFFDYGE
ncbi:uncharacterized protein LOC105428965 [Pogonomyrmex barbatus]|uniref:Uncharacterized protein LOC105428965 n=1 Tax=Pogonomyrmex barbatus TaxID=144034 RepID=A0A8N1S6A6_9HYME|nr:uncharacterized protein LOC105428965 [Pogonomyrmex barbatus]XP_025074435.1 uncharacterized protein LOC105428965 [Pogonomyrmex barbatus]